MSEYKYKKTTCSSLQYRFIDYSERELYLSIKVAFERSDFRTRTGGTTV